MALKTEPKQLSLPIETLQENMHPKYAEIVKQNWKLTFSKQYLSSVYTKRVMGLIAAQIKSEGIVQEYYQITADKIITETGLSRQEVYKCMKGVTYELAMVTFFIEDEKTNKYIPRHLLDTTRFENPAGYYNGKLTVAFNPQLIPFVKEMANYSQYELSSYVNFNSWYSMRLYEILSAFRYEQEVEFGIIKYRNWMGCGVETTLKGEAKTDRKTGKVKFIKYQKHTDMINRTTREPLEDFKGTDLEFTVEPVYESTGRGRPSITKVRFTFTKPKKRPNTEELIEKWKTTQPRFIRMHERLKALSVYDSVTVKYLPHIGEKKMNKLLYEWEERSRPDAKYPIVNPEKYCNKAMKDAGIAAQIEKADSKI